MKTMTMIAAEAVEEKSIDRQYNAKRKERQTHLEVMGGGISYTIRAGRVGFIIQVEVEQCKLEI